MLIINLFFSLACQPPPASLQYRSLLHGSKWSIGCIGCYIYKRTIDSFLELAMLLIFSKPNAPIIRNMLHPSDCLQISI